MRKSTIIGAIALVVLGGLVILAFTLPAGLGLKPVTARPGPPPTEDVIKLTGVVRDFTRDHADFDVTPTGGHGHYAGNVQLALGPDRVPVFTGLVDEHETIDTFEIIEGRVVPSGPFAAMITVLGAQIQNGELFLPVTTRIRIGDDVLEPFGPFDAALAGDVNAEPMPRPHIVPTTYPALTPITAEGRSWKLASGADKTKESSWSEHLSFDSNLTTPMIKVLRDGDPVPEIPGFQDQAALADFIQDYIDTSSGTVVLHDYQAIVLFELGVTNLSSPAADFQDLVLLITLATGPDILTLYDAYGDEVVDTDTIESFGYHVDEQWRDKGGNPIAPHLYHPGRGDVAGVRGVESAGGIGSTESFHEWFTDQLGTNLSTSHTIELRPVGGGVYAYDTNAFYPIDDQLLGNENRSHNHFFTYTITADFKYRAGTGQFLEFDGTDDAWVFVDNRLVMDRGGVVPPEPQYIELDRLGLLPGGRYQLRFFYAQRQSSYAEFDLRTNIFTEGTVGTRVPVTIGYD